MTAEAVFREQLRDVPDPLDDPDRARRIAAAAQAALGAAGTSISVMVAQVRVPFGASDSGASHAESIQFTEGQGPCLDAIATNGRIDAPTAELTRRWPELARRWLTETPFRSAFSEPLSADGWTGALDVYQTHDDGRGRLSDLEATTVGGLVAEQLRNDLYAATDTSDIDRRALVWVALGMIREHYGFSARQALVRAQQGATRASLTIDDYAAQLLQGRDLL